MRPKGPKSYQSLAEFEREELRRDHKAGWSLDDLYSEATFDPGEDDSLARDEPRELDFDF
ncbi:MAG: hypothetical protein WAU39_07970 [Polyangiales bacterium]